MKEKVTLTELKQFIKKIVIEETKNLKGRNKILKNKLPIDKIREKLKNNNNLDEFALYNDYKALEDYLPGFKLENDNIAGSFDANGNLITVFPHAFVNKSIKLKKPFDLISYMVEKGKWDDLQQLAQRLKIDTSLINKTEKYKDDSIYDPNNPDPWANSEWEETDNTGQKYKIKHFVYPSSKRIGKTMKKVVKEQFYSTGHFRKISKSELEILKKNPVITDLYKKGMIEISRDTISNEYTITWKSKKDGEYIVNILHMDL